MAIFIYLGLTAIEPEWLPVYAKSLCKTIKVLDEPKPKYNEEIEKMYCTVNATYGNNIILFCCIMYY